MSGTSKTAETKDKSSATRPAGFEVGAAMREATEAGLGQAKEAYDSYKSLAEDATGLFEESFSSVNQGVSAFQAKFLDAGRKNVDAGFDFATRALAAKSVTELMELQTQFARQQFEALSQQARDFQELTTKVQSDAAKPFKEGVSKMTAQFQRAS